MTLDLCGCTRIYIYTLNPHHTSEFWCSGKNFNNIYAYTRARTHTDPHTHTHSHTHTHTHTLCIKLHGVSVGLHSKILVSLNKSGVYFLWDTKIPWEDCAALILTNYWTIWNPWSEILVTKFCSTSKSFVHLLFIIFCSLYIICTNNHNNSPWLCMLKKTEWCITYIWSSNCITSLLNCLKWAFEDWFILYTNFHK